MRVSIGMTLGMARESGLTPKAKNTKVCITMEKSTAAV